MTLVTEPSEVNSVGAYKTEDRGETGSNALRIRQLSHRIEKDIHFGRLSAGSWLKQVDLKDMYGASRLDIRHALDRLEEKGLVKLETNRGYRVETFSEERYRNILTIRQALEATAAEEVFKHIDAIGLARAQELAVHFAKTVVMGTIEEKEESNHDFHRALLSYCPNRELVAMIFDLRHSVPATASRQRNTDARFASAAQDHFHMVECLVRRDREGFIAVTRHHLRWEKEDR